MPLGIAISLAAVVLAGSPGSAHKPITSPFMFNEDVFPIVREHCGSCHVRGGPAPMSLLTHGDSVPWGESLRLELISGHMPPWQAESEVGFSNVRRLTGRELNVLLTWAAGGTPIGSTERTPPPLAYERRWPLGQPDLVLDAPASYTMAADRQEATNEFTVATGTKEDRWLRAVDLLPGSAPMVRSATVSVRRPTSNRGDVETLLALWNAGDRPLALERAGLLLPAGSELIVRIAYRKTWEYERVELTDRSAVGLYFAPAGPSLRQVELAAVKPASLTGGSATVRQTLGAALSAFAIYPEPGLSGVNVRVIAARPDGRREELIAFRPRAGWARRYWFREPVHLPPGTVIETTVRADDGRLLPPGATASPAFTGDGASLVLNYVN